jgi:hypothetical protein
MLRPRRVQSLSTRLIDSSTHANHADWISDDAVLPTAVDELHCDSHIGYETEPDSHLRQCYAIT